MTGFLERIKRFLNRTKSQNKILESSSITPVFTEGCDFSNHGEFSKWDTEPPTPKTEKTKTVITTEKRQSFHPSVNFEKMARQERIRLANVQKQRNTLGYGLKTRNFKPRPATEKQLYDLSKKPADD